MVSLACWEGSETGAALLFGSAQYSLHTLTGSGSRFPALCWDCPGCGQQATDRAPAGRTVHVEHGHAPGCARWLPTRPPKRRSAASGWRG